MPATATAARVAWTRLAPGSYESRVVGDPTNDGNARVFTNCEVKGCTCPRWELALSSGPHHIYNLGGFQTMAEAKAWAASEILARVWE